MRDKQGPVVAADIAAWIGNHEAELPSGADAEHSQPKLAGLWGTETMRRLSMARDRPVRRAVRGRRPRTSRLKARCDQLFTTGRPCRVAARRRRRRAQPRGAGRRVDCRKGRYEQGIAVLEKVLRSQGYTVSARS